MKKICAAVFLASVLSTSATADPKHEPPAMPKEFDALKKLVGAWEGTSKMEGKDMTVTVVYELTSGGTALMEKLAPGTPMEMISVYHKTGKTIGMTHYCAMGNSPQMVLKKADDKSVAFEMTKPLGITSMKEPHMHAVTLTMSGPDELKQEWQHYMNGKKADSVVFAFKRKK